MAISIPGILFDDSFAGGKKSVTLVWHPVQVDLISSNGEARKWNYAEVEFSVGGSRDSLLFIKHKSGQTAYFHLDEVQVNELQKMAVLPTQLTNLLAKRTTYFHKELALILVIIGIISAVIYYRAPIFGKLAESIPFSFEKKVADAYFSRTSVLLDRHKDAEIALNNFAKNSLFNSEDEWHKNLTLHLSASPDMNAFATIGGHLFVNLGLIKGLDSAEEILGVIAHEVAHARERHVVRTISQGLGLFVFIQALLGDVSGLAAVLVDQSGTLLQLAYSRDLEAEADAKAVEYLFSAGINPIGLVTALEKIDQNYKELLKSTPGGDVIDKMQKAEFLRSHPETEARVQALHNIIANHAPTGKKWKDHSVQWKKLKEQIQKL